MRHKLRSRRCHHCLQGELSSSSKPQKVLFSSLNTSDASRCHPAGANPNGEVWLNGAVKVWGTSTDILFLLIWGEPGTASGNKQISYVPFGS